MYKNIIIVTLSAIILILLTTVFIPSTQSSCLPTYCPDTITIYNYEERCKIKSYSGNYTNVTTDTNSFTATDTNSGQTLYIQGGIVIFEDN